MLFANRMRNACCLSAIVLACGVAAAHADPVGCEQNNVALARVVASEVRVNFIAGRSERTPACPSAERGCRLRAYLVPGDEVLVDTADGPYVCTSSSRKAAPKREAGCHARRFRSRGRSPRRCVNGTGSGDATGRRRSSSNPVRMSWRFPAMPCGAAATLSASSEAEFTSAS
jgi:hypothetical protein